MIDGFGLLDAGHDEEHVAGNVGEFPGRGKWIVSGAVDYVQLIQVSFDLVELPVILGLKKHFSETLPIEIFNCRNISIFKAFLQKSAQNR